MDLIEYYKSKVYPFGENYAIDGGSNYLYMFHNKTFNLFKIGITLDPKKRVSEVIRNSGCEISIIGYLYLEPECDESPMLAERTIHEYFKNYRKFGEWFSFGKRQLCELRRLAYEIDSEYLVINYGK